MIIVGDIASPSELFSNKLYDFFEENHIIFNNQTIVCNFEGLISKDRSLKEKTPILFNHPSIFKALDKGNVKVAALANNHILDLPFLYDHTISLLKSNNINFLGAGKSKKKAFESIIVEENGIEVFIINACWDFLLYHQKNPTNSVYVNTLNENEILKQVKEIRHNYPDAKIMTYFHWNFDLERLPFPMYRQFSRELIDTGVSLVVGAHAHCVQGGELYKDGCIIYGLGNFFIPNAVFVDSKLKFPEWAAEQLAIEWDVKENNFKCHWFVNRGTNIEFNIKYLESSDFIKCNKIIQYSPFMNLSNEEYLSFFRKNRRKRLLIPIFINYNDKLLNDFKMFFLKTRAKIARFIAGIGLIKWQN